MGLNVVLFLKWKDIAIRNQVIALRAIELAKGYREQRDAARNVAMRAELRLEQTERDYEGW